MPWIVMKIAYTTTEMVIKITNGLIGDFSDFAIEISRQARVGNQTGLPTVRPKIAFLRADPRAGRLAILTGNHAARAGRGLRDDHHVLELFG
jgi:hypothetical protein